MCKNLLKMMNPSDIAGNTEEEENENCYFEINSPGLSFQYISQIWKETSCAMTDCMIKKDSKFVKNKTTQWLLCHLSLHEFTQMAQIIGTSFWRHNGTYEGGHKKRGEEFKVL